MRGTPVLVSDGTDIDRSQCKRIVPMKVLVLGLCRTGTMCKASFSQLGIVSLAAQLLTYAVLLLY